MIDKNNELVIVWTVDDVRQAARDIEYPADISDEIAMEALRRADRRHDATIGMNWDIITECLLEVIGGKRNEQNT